MVGTGVGTDGSKKWRMVYCLSRRSLMKRQWAPSMSLTSFSSAMNETWLGLVAKIFQSGSDKTCTCFKLSHSLDQFYQFCLGRIRSKLIQFNWVWWEKSGVAWSSNHQMDHYWQALGRGTKLFSLVKEHGGYLCELRERTSNGVITVFWTARKHLLHSFKDNFSHSTHW